MTDNSELRAVGKIAGGWFDMVKVLDKCFDLLVLHSLRDLFRRLLVFQLGCDIFNESATESLLKIWSCWSYSDTNRGLFL